MAPLAAKAVAIAGAAATGATNAVVAAPSGRRTSRRILARPRRIVSRQTASISQAAWTLIVALLGLALLALVLNVATTRPAVVTEAVNVVPNALRKFVNPFGDNPLAATSIQQAPRRAPAIPKART